MLNNVLIENISSMISEREKNEPHCPRAIVITRGQSKSSRHRLVVRLGCKLPMRVCQALTGQRQAPTFEDRGVFGNKPCKSWPSKRIWYVIQVTS